MLSCNALLVPQHSKYNINVLVLVNVHKTFMSSTRGSAHIFYYIFIHISSPAVILDFSTLV